MNIFKAISAAWQIKSEVGKMKSGFMTSEFWLSAITIIGLVIGVFIGKIPVELLAVGVVILPSVYTITRTLLKKNAAGLEILEAVEKNILEKLPGYVPPAHTDEPK